MATIIRGEPDPRFAVLEQGVTRGVENFFQERERAKKEQKFQDAFRAVNSAQNYDEAVKAMGLVDREILANPQALALLGEQIERRFPPQEAVTIDDGLGNISTKAVRKGDVTGALSAAEESGGRLVHETTLERQRNTEDAEATAAVLKTRFDQDVANKKLAMEERRTKAAELRARAAAEKAKAGGDLSEKDKEIMRLSKILGGDVTRAMKIVYGLEQTDLDPATGEVRVLDKATRRAMVIPAELANEIQTVPTPEEGKTLWDAALAGTGPFSALRAASALPTAYFGVFEPKKTIEARGRLDTAVQGFIRAVANSERFPVAEQERIRKDFGIGSSMWVHPETLRRRMVTLNTDLKLKLAQSKRDSTDPALPGKDRASAKRDVTEISNFLAQMGVPEEHEAGRVQEVSGVPEVVQQKYPEVTFERWNRYTPEQKRRLQEGDI